jgi:hypothetical protein
VVPEKPRDARGDGFRLNNSGRAERVRPESANLAKNKAVGLDQQWKSHAEARVCTFGEQFL